MAMDGDWSRRAGLMPCALDDTISKEPVAFYCHSLGQCRMLSASTFFSGLWNNEAMMHIYTRERNMETGTSRYTSKDIKVHTCVHSVTYRARSEVHPNHLFILYTLIAI
jgi:hypothetical protein